MTPTPETATDAGPAAQDEIEALRRERNEALAYLKAFVAATIDPEDKRQDVQIHQANPTLGWVFTLNDTGMRGVRQILGSQIRRSMEIVGFDKLKIEAPETTVADDNVRLTRELAEAKAAATKNHAETRAFWAALIPPSPRCRDCADFDGRCQGDGAPCDPQEHALENLGKIKSELSEAKARIGEAVAAERAACWQIAMDAARDCGTHYGGGYPQKTCVEIATSIFARGGEDASR